jgi:GTP cyclohydrolase I
MTTGQPSREEAEQAVATLLRWIGDDPDRAGLRRTPQRVVDAYLEHFRGYGTSPEAILGTEGIVLLRDIAFESHCEHHLAPMIGRAHLAYRPGNRVVGIGCLARLVDCFAKRLQVQERLTAQIAEAIQDTLQPKGVAVLVEATHHCMTTRGAHRPGATMVTSRYLGCFETEPADRQEFLALITGPGGIAGR